jgi:multidrug efflux system membrane fusion protein
MRFKRLRNRRTLALFVAIGVLIGVTALLADMDNTVDIKKQDKADLLPLVTVENVSAGEQSLVIEAYAEIKPRWVIDLKSDVSGVIVRMHPLALAGSRVRKDEPLFVIDDIRYQAELAEAERACREAELDQQRAVYTTRVAQRQFDSAGAQPPNDLALHLPQLNIANATVKAARAHVKVAKQQLDHTVVRAPYSGYIVERHISPGQKYMAGDLVARLIDDSHYDIAVGVSKSDWQRLKHPIQGQKVSLFNEQGNAVGKAVVRESGGYRDEETRHYIVHLYAQRAEIDALAGDLVKVRFQGRTEHNTLSIPASALTSNGSVWWIESESTLARGVVDVLSHNDDRVLIRAPHNRAEWQVVAMPQSSYLPGQNVRTTTEAAW